jgi:hypothetical protein
LIAKPLSDSPVSGSPAAARRMYELQERVAGEPGRAAIEQFIADRFSSVHRARVCSFMPSLVGLTDRAGSLRCALGYRPAAAGALFLEQYLDSPIEQAIRAAAATHNMAGGPVDRQGIVEVGNLAGRGCRMAMYLVAQLPRFLLERGYSWITFTATQRVRDILGTFDAPLIDLGPADPARLQRRGDDWGDYYDAQPRVMAGWLPHGLRSAR